VWTYSVTIGTWDLNWNTTLSSGKTYKTYSDSDAATSAPTFPTTTTGVAGPVTGGTVTDSGCYTGYTTWAASGADTISLLSGLLSIAFFS
jgi:hypothetical protein